MMMKILLITVLSSLILFSRVTPRNDQLVSERMLPAIEELKDFVAIPNDALVAEDIDKNVDWARNAFTKRGFEISVLKTDKMPLFLAEKAFQGSRKTVLFYFHLDGQAVRQQEWFQQNAYSAVLKQRDQTGAFSQIDWSMLRNGKINDEWRLFGRSTSDDKGPIVMFLQAMDMLSSQKQQPPFNIKVVLDCEEEKGSPGLKGALASYKTELAADYLIVMDGPMHSSNLPTLTFGCRVVPAFR
jgi:acetylornithine deacetylase/succinyl-diaminopimelate desuccinylase-like protein